MKFRWLGLAVFLLLLASAGAWAQALENLHLPEMNIPDIKIEPMKDSKIPAPLQIMFLITSLSLIPALIVSCTAWIRTTITLSYLKNALGSPQMLSNQLMVGMAMIITFYIMYPVGLRMHDTAFVPYMDGTIEQEEFRVKLISPLREFMMAQTRPKDLAFFVKLGKLDVHSIKDVPFIAVLPAFIMSEIKTAFMIGFLIYIPFLVIDMVVATALMSMGMMMLSPMQIAMPFKLMLFCNIDGWHIIIVGLLKSFNRPPWMDGGG